MVRIELAGQSARDDSNVSGNPSRLVNLFREVMVPGGRAQYALRSVPGMATFATTGRVFPRALAKYNSVALAICGGHLFQIDELGEVQDLGTLNGDEASGIDRVGDYAVIVADGMYYTLMGEVLTAQATGAISAAGSVTSLGNYALISEAGGRIVQWSDLADPTTMSGLNFKSAEITVESITRLMVAGDVLFVFKPTGFERWGVTGLAGPDAFARISGSQIDVGLAGYSLITNMPGGLAFVGNDGRFHLWGEGLQPVSTPPVEYAIEHSTPASVFYYSLRGHGFVCLTFTDREAWCFDLATGEWHERRQGEGPWTARLAAQVWGKWNVIGETGLISQATGLCADFGQPMPRIATGRPIENGGMRFKLALVEAFTRTGLDRQTSSDSYYVLAAGDAALSNDDIRLIGDSGWDSGPASVELRTSRDGLAFGDWKARGVGEKGNFRTRLAWRSLGQFRTAVLEFRLTTALDIPLMAAVEVEAA